MEIITFLILGSLFAMYVLFLSKSSLFKSDKDFENEMVKRHELLYAEYRNKPIIVTPGQKITPSYIFKGFSSEEIITLRHADVGTELSFAVKDNSIIEIVSYVIDNKQKYTVKIDKPEYNQNRLTVTNLSYS